MKANISAARADFPTVQGYTGEIGSLFGPPGFKVITRTIILQRDSNPVMLQCQTRRADINPGIVIVF